MQTFPLESTVLLMSAKAETITFYNRVNNSYTLFNFKNSSGKNAYITLWKDSNTLHVNETQNLPIPCNTPNCTPDEITVKNFNFDDGAGPNHLLADVWITNSELIIGTTDMRDGVASHRFIIPPIEGQIIIEYTSVHNWNIYHIKRNYSFTKRYPTII
jgi:hypothetical protein